MSLIRVLFTYCSIPKDILGRELTVYMAVFSCSRSELVDLQSSSAVFASSRPNQVMIHGQIIA